MSVAGRNVKRSVPRIHASRSHPQLLRELAAASRSAFSNAEQPWDPSRDRHIAPDPGRGFLDCLALPLHILWTYQEAWAREGFLDTLEMPVSRARLLELVATAPTPAIAATGLQHFHVKPGRSTTLQPGFKISAPAANGKAQASFETLVAANVSYESNSFLPYLTGVAALAPTTGDIAYSAQLLEPLVVTPLPGEALQSQLEKRLAAGRAGDTQTRNAQRQQARALARAETLTELQNTGEVDPFSAAFQQLCEEVCEAQRLANEVPVDAAFAPLSEAQEILLGQIGNIAKRHPSAMNDLEAALCRNADESDSEWSRRLDQTTNFLDTLVTSLMQNARDQLARLHGPDSLSALDRAYRNEKTNAINTPARGLAAAGTDSLFLLPHLDGSDTAPRTQADVLRPGDWLVVGETLDSIDRDGAPVRKQHYREAVRITRVREEIPPGGSLASPMTRIVFEPSLSRNYNLNTVELLGNMVPVSHGNGIRRTVTHTQIANTGVELTSEPLTWLPDPRAPAGRTATVSLRINGQDWVQVPLANSADAPPGAYFLSVDPEGIARLMVGAGEIDAPIPVDARIEITYREGAGTNGNRAAHQVYELASANSAVDSTFNPLPVAGGVAAETPEQTQRAGIGASILDRAVSVGDVRTLTLAYGSVHRARVFRDALRSRTRLNVVVSGHEGDALDPSDLSALHAFLAARVAPGVILHIENRRLAELRARIRLAINAGADPLTIVAIARARLGLERLLDEPLGLLDPKNSELGADVNLSDLHGALADIPDLHSVHIEALHLQGVASMRADRIAIESRALPVWANSAPDREPVELVWEEARDL